MPEGSWERLLPSAWTPQANPNAQVEAGNAASANIANMARTGSDIETARQDRVRKQALQDIMAQSIETVIGPDGKPTHHFSNDKFLSLLPTNKAAADAYALWNEKINPANATMATQRGMAQSTTPEGGLDAGALAKAAQGSEYAGQILAAGRGIQREQATTATDIGANRLAQSVFATPGTEPVGSLVGNDQMTARQPSAAAAPSTALTADTVAGLPKADREAAIYNLKAQGFPLPPNATNADIAAAANTAADNAVRTASVQGADLKTPLSYGTSAIAAQTAAPEIRQKVFGNIFGKPLDLAQQKTSLARAKLETEGLAEGVSSAKSLADKLLITDERIGNSTDKEVQERIRNAQSAVDALGQLRTNINSIMAKIDAGELQPNSVAGNAYLAAELIAQIGLLSRVYGGTNTEGSIQRAMEDIGAPKNIVSAALHGGVDKAVAAWLANKASDITQVLRTAPKRAAQSVQSVLSDAGSSNPSKVLRNAGYADLLPKGFPGSAFPKPGAAKPGTKYVETKVNTLGVKVGKLPNGNWEQVPE